MVSNPSPVLYITVCSISPKVLVSRSWTHNLSHQWDIRVISSCLQTAHLRLNNYMIYKLTCFLSCLLKHEFKSWATRRTLLPLAVDSWELAIRSSVVGRGRMIECRGLAAVAPSVLLPLYSIIATFTLKVSLQRKRALTVCTCASPDVGGWGREVTLLIVCCPCPLLVCLFG